MYEKDQTPPLPQIFTVHIYYISLKENIIRYVRNVTYTRYLRYAKYISYIYEKDQILPPPAHLKHSASVIYVVWSLETNVGIQHDFYQK